MTESPSDTGRMPSLAQPTSTERRIAVLGPTLRFKGDLSAEEDFILLGRIEGSVHQAQRIVVASGGAVVGTIYARVVVVDGHVQGDLYGLESVTVHKTGRVMGNIFAPRVVLIEGAVFNGRIDMSGASVAERDSKQIAHQAQKVILVPPPAVRERAAVGA
jgi:cytoskeletal protein CcmA (bactofilin family)